MYCTRSFCSMIHPYSTSVQYLRCAHSNLYRNLSWFFHVLFNFPATTTRRPCGFGSPFETTSDHDPTDTVRPTIFLLSLRNTEARVILPVPHCCVAPRWHQPSRPNRFCSRMLLHPPSRLGDLPLKMPRLSTAGTS